MMAKDNSTAIMIKHSQTLQNPSLSKDTVGLPPSLMHFDLFYIMENVTGRAGTHKGG